MRLPAFLIGLTLVAAPLLAGCGFTPLYATPGLAPALSGIETIAPEGRLGALLREQMDDAVARDRSAPATMRLEMSLKQVRTARGRRIDNVATRYELVATADWRLTSLADGQVVRTGQTRAEVTVDSTDQPYAAVAAQQDAESRLAGELARRIQLDISTWLYRQKTGS
ncbi:LPS-assembly lipoprotein [Caulobacter ginsengisoli]|uniref:LPS-assembly lipoprotein n=1 Tax=Caulobacter ginsengisoli TaxID=400775 RepID=A0ABU0ITK4_9CAUL|nr:LPS assembly lipoprotein LptE [Caulobacter ginsengisoli]MDQ0465319.1 LPS-assembly lipoprotein [Caulobacter ginsengisoli]